jgi:protein tyrosine phosphatase (PTP) superfamily phosphohydrolase (DUF442 family)
MKLHLDWLRTGRAPRGTPRRGDVPRRLVALGLITGLALVQAGCQSGPNGCGSCSSCGFFRRATDRVLRRTPRYEDAGVVGGAAVEYGAPAAVVAPSIGSPQFPAGTVPSNVTVPPTTLEPLENPPKVRSVPAPGTSSNSTGSGAKATGFYTRQTSTRTAARLDAGPPPRRASAARPAEASSSDPASRDEDNLFDHLPPLALPGEVTQAETKTPAPSAPRPEGSSGDLAIPEKSTRAETPRAEDGVGVTLAADPSPEADSSASPAGPAGIARFASVDLRLAGGGAPTTAGLAWLAEKGYRTVLDLRESAEVSPAFIAEAANRGLRYVALPVNLKTFDAERLARFQFELAAPEARPLFFFDADGTRAGALWYIRRVTVDKVDPQLARREAEDIGLKDRSAWQAVTDYVQRTAAAQAHPAPASPPRAHGSTPQPAAPSDAGTVASNAPPKTESRPQPADSPESRDPMSWRRFAAMLFTGLSLPLAYWTRMAIPEAIARVRASLPAPAPRPRSLPDESGA